ncbi:hypothetical protein C1646_772657 [Rhizophagus diaphanus]|nr:hypothetical protein C1646_772657 [Rhizophagus diaphanus] [Rhizophagus sp. MUCL 43196]
MQEKQNDNSFSVNKQGALPVFTPNDMLDHSQEAAAGSHKERQKNSKEYSSLKSLLVLGTSSSSSLTPVLVFRNQQTNTGQSDNSLQQQTQQTNASQSDLTKQQQTNKPPKTSQNVMTPAPNKPDTANISMQNVDLDSQVTTSIATRFLKNTRDYLISDPILGPDVQAKKKREIIGYRLIINVTSQKIYNEIMTIDFSGTRSRTVQIYNVPLEITTSILKPFLRRYGMLEDNGVYATRRNPYQPNKQIFYATYKENANADAFYGQPILWVYNEILYVTPMELNEESMQRGTNRVIVRRNKQYEWSIPDMKSYFNCGFTSHLISECDYHPPRNKPINKKEYLNSVRQYQPGYRRRQIRYNDRQRQDKYRQDNPYSNNQNHPWNRYNIRKKQDDTYNYEDDEQEMYEWNIEEGSSEEIQRANNKASVLFQSRSIQKHTNSLQKNDDIVANLAKSLEQTTTQISLYMQTSSNKEKAKAGESNDDAMVIDQLRKVNNDNR